MHNIPLVVPVDQNTAPIPARYSVVFFVRHFTSDVNRPSGQWWSYRAIMDVELVAQNPEHAESMARGLTGHGSFYLLSVTRLGDVRDLPEERAP